MKNLKRYYQAWELRQQGKKLREIAQIMGNKSPESARWMISYVNYRIDDKRLKSKELRRLIEKYRST